jgi:type II secretory pathway predicted ATPase ExeA
VTIDRLRAHWGLTRMPFSKDLAPSMLHTHRSHAEAAARISWCVEERAIGLVTGEVGAGKSVAVRAALSGLDASRHTVIYLGNPSVGTRGLYSTIVTTLGGTPRFHRASLIPQAAEALATEEDERGRRVVLVLDEAHLLDGDQLEGLRMLTNVDIDSRSPFACLLVGQPTLRRRIRLGAFAALDQRVALQRRDVELRGPSPEDRRPDGHAVLRRRPGPRPPGVAGPAPGRQQPGRAVPRRRLRREQVDRGRVLGPGSGDRGDVGVTTTAPPT